MATVYDKIWLPIKLRKRSQEQESNVKAEALNTVPEFDTTQKRQVGLFHIAGLVSEEGLQNTIHQGLRYLERVIQEAEADIHHRPVWMMMENFYVFYSEMISLMSLIKEYYPNDDYKLYASEGKEELRQLYHRVKFSATIYRALKIDDCAEKEEEILIRGRFIAQYEKLGYSMNNECDSSLHEKIIDLIEKYKSNISTDNKIDLTQSTSSRDFLRNEAYCDAEKVVNVCSHTYSHYHAIREAGFKTFYAYDGVQAEILDNILHARNELAKFLNYSTYAQMMAKETILGKVKDVSLFLTYLQENIKDYADKEYAIMTSLKLNLDNNHPFVISDVRYITEWARDQISQEEQDNIPAYLTLGQCIDGINQILMNICFIHFDINNILYDEVYCQNMYKLQVIHVTHGIISYVFLDLMKRPGKPKKTTHYILREGKREETNDYIPKLKWRPIRIVLVMNIERSGFPAELSIREAESLFMEIGRMLPALYYHKQHQFIIRSASLVDFSHIIAQLMRELFYDPRIMKIIYKVYPDGEGLTPHQIDNIILSRKIFKASEYQMLVFRSSVDQVLYGEQRFGRLKTVMNKLAKKLYGVPMFEDCFYHLRDVDMVDEKTSGKIFNTLIDQIVVKQLWKRFLADDPLNSESGDSLGQLMKECMFLTDPYECYSKLLDMEFDVVKIGKIIIQDMKESFEETEKVLAELIEDSKAEEEPIIEDDNHVVDIYSYFCQYYD